MWCCSHGGNTTSCCNDASDGSNLFPWAATPANIQNGSNFADGYTIAPTFSTALPPSRSTRPTLSTVTDPPSKKTGEPARQKTFSASRVPTAQNSTSDHNAAVEVGVVVGAGVGAPLLAGLAAFLCLWLRERRVNKALRRDLDLKTLPYEYAPAHTYQVTTSEAGPGTWSRWFSKIRPSGSENSGFRGPMDFQKFSRDNLNAELPSRSRNGYPITTAAANERPLASAFSHPS